MVVRGIWLGVIACAAVGLSALAWAGPGGGGRETTLSLGIGVANDGEGVSHQALLGRATMDGYLVRGGYWGSTYADDRIVVATNILAAGWDIDVKKYGALGIGAQVSFARVCDQTSARFPGESSAKIEKSVSGGLGTGLDVRLPLGPLRFRAGWESYLFVGDWTMLIEVATLKKTIVFAEIGGAL